MFQVDRYKMSIVEKGTPYTEQIEIDEKQDFEIFRVPAHNDVDGAEFYHDFKMVRLVRTFRAGYRFACNKTVTPAGLIVFVHTTPKELKPEVSR